MTHQESTGPGSPAPATPHTVPLETSAQDASASEPSSADTPTTAITATEPISAPSADTEPLQPDSRTAELGAAPPPGTAPHTPPPPGRPTRRARFGARWRTSLPLRAATAVLVAVLIGGIGFAAGSFLNGGDGHHRARHELSANHPFWQDHEGWIHRGEHGGMHRFHPGSGPVDAPAATPARAN